MERCAGRLSASSPAMERFMSQWGCGVSTIHTARPSGVRADWQHAATWPRGARRHACQPSRRGDPRRSCCRRRRPPRLAPPLERLHFDCRRLLLLDLLASRLATLHSLQLRRRLLPLLHLLALEPALVHRLQLGGRSVLLRGGTDAARENAARHSDRVAAIARRGGRVRRKRKQLSDEHISAHSHEG